MGEISKISKHKESSMRKTEKNLSILTILFVVSLIISNVITGKIINTGIPFWGSVITIPCAVLCYPITFLITDVVGEVWGKNEANHIVRLGLISQIAATIIIIIGKYLPFIDAEMQQAYIKILGQNWIFVIGSLTAYLVSQNLDVHIFHRLRDKYIKEHGSTKGGRWIWNNASTMTSQFVDTLIFITIAFGFGFGWIFNNQIALIGMLIGQYLVKLIIAALDTPFFYFMTKNRTEIN